jgi:hypothetical protein
VPDNVVELFAGSIAFNQHLDADGLETHVLRLLDGAAGAPCRRIADVAFQEDFEFAQLDLAVGGDGDDADGQTTAQPGQDDFAWRGSGILAKQM